MGFFSSAKDSPEVGGVLSKWAGEIEVDKQKKAVKAYGNEMMNFIGSLSQEQQMNPDVLKQGEAKISAKYDLPPQARKLFIDMMYESGTRQQGAEDREYQKQLRGQAQEDRSKKIFRENIGIADQALMQEADSPQPFGQEGVFATPARDKGSAIEQMSYAGRKQYEKDLLDKEKKEADIAYIKAQTLSKNGGHKFSAPQMLAIKQIQEMIAAGDSLGNINYVARAAGLGQFKETSTGEMVEIPNTGFFGFFMGKEPGKKIVPADGTEGAPSKLQGMLSRLSSDSEKVSTESKEVTPRTLTRPEKTQAERFAESPIGKTETAVGKIPELISQSEKANIEALKKISSRKEKPSIPGVGTFKRKAADPIDIVVNITGGTYDSENNEINFTPENDTELQKILNEMDKAGIPFDAKQNTDGSYSVTIKEQP